MMTMAQSLAVDSAGRLTGNSMLAGQPVSFVADACQQEIVVKLNPAWFSLTSEAGGLSLTHVRAQVDEVMRQDGAAGMTSLATETCDFLARAMADPWNGDFRCGIVRSCEALLAQVPVLQNQDQLRWLAIEIIGTHLMHAYRACGPSEESFLSELPKSRLTTMRHRVSGTVENTFALSFHRAVGSSQAPPDAETVTLFTGAGVTITVRDVLESIASQSAADEVAQNHLARRSDFIRRTAGDTRTMELIQVVCEIAREQFPADLDPEACRLGLIDAIATWLVNACDNSPEASNSGRAPVRRR